ncbi:MAG TPA: hypothetical protein VGB54_15425 [Allosphingosinicella sp.]|jgi:hypothetical protein
MDKDRIQFGNEGEELVPGKTENLSSSFHAQGDAAMPHDKIDQERSQRGTRGGFDPKTGEVHGSGSNAGGGGAPGEDYDQDSAGGATKAAPQVPDR